MRQSTLTREHIQIDQLRIKITVLYFVMIAGGLWHFIGMFQPLMNVLASPIIFGVGILLFGEQLQWMFKSDSHNIIIRKFILWSIVVIVFSLSVEIIGVNTGLIFGNYNYGKNLKPLIFGTPIAIGFAWFSMLISATALSQTLLKEKLPDDPLKAAFIIATVMVGFDYLMEPAAVKLGYWSWQNDLIPIRNYASWFFVSFAFTLTGMKWKLFSVKVTPIAFHAFFAQLIYFAFVVFS